MAADALLPVAACIVHEDNEEAQELTDILWDILLDLGELKPSTGAYSSFKHLHPSPASSQRSLLYLCNACSPSSKSSRQVYHVLRLLDPGWTGI